MASRSRLPGAVEFDLPITRAWLAETIACKDAAERSRAAAAVAEAVRWRGLQSTRLTPPADAAQDGARPP